MWQWFRTVPLVLVALAIGVAESAHGEDLARLTTTVTQEVVAGGVDLDAPTMLALPKQGIILVDAVPTLPAVSVEQTLSVSDKRGTLSPITVSVEVTPMSNTESPESKRDLTLRLLSTEGDTESLDTKEVSTSGAPVTEPEFITGAPEVNRCFSATIALTAAELTAKEAVSGAWTGQVTYTVN